MPMYSFKCDCGNTGEELGSMSNPPKHRNCTICGDRMYRDYGDVRVGGTPSHKPVVSQSMAIGVEQIPEHREKFPDVQVHSDGVLQFKSNKQKDSYMEKTGFYQPPKKEKIKGRPL